MTLPAIKHSLLHLSQTRLIHLTRNDFCNQELLKYEVQDMSFLSSDTLGPDGGSWPARKRTSLLSLVCRVVDEAMQVAEPAIEVIGEMAVAAQSDYAAWFFLCTSPQCEEVFNPTC